MSTRVLWLGYAGVMCAAAAVDVWVPFGAAPAVIVAGATSALAVVIGVRRNRPPRERPWLMLAAAVILNAAARVLYDALPGTAGSLKPWEWTVWVLQAAVLLLLAAGVLGLARSTLRGVSAAIDVSIILLGAGLLGGVLIAIPFTSTPGVGELGRLLRVGYVLQDVLLLAVVIHVATALRWSRSLAWLLGGMTSLVVYDVLFRLGRLRGEWLEGTTIDFVWILFFVGIGAAALSRSMASVDTSARPRDVAPLRIGLVAILALIPSGVLLIGLFHRPPWYQALIVVAATLILVLALARIVDVGIQLRRQVTGERALREAVTELAGVTDAASVIPLLHRAVESILGTNPRYEIVQTDSEPDVSEVDRALPIVPGAGRGETRLIPIPIPSPVDLGTEVADDGDDGAPTHGADHGLALLVWCDRGMLGSVCPRLEVLATQAGFALERIRLANENLRHVGEAYFRTLVQNTADVILIIDADNAIRYASPSAENMFGARSLVGVAMPELVAPSARPAAQQLLWRARHRAASDDGDESVGPTRAVFDHNWLIDGDDDDEPTLVDASCRDLRSDPSIDGLVLTLRDVTEQRELERELEYRAYHDPLTGLPNRVPFIERLRANLRQNPDDAGLTVVLYIDVDELKLVNDALGHDAGDTVLIAFADRLRHFVAAHTAPSDSMAARLSGDEFAVQLRHVADHEAATRAASYVVDELRRPVSVAGYEVTCGASIGLATTADASTELDLLRNADLALYSAKRLGRGQWRHYQPAMRHAVLARLDVRTALERAIHDDALMLDYQPIVALADGQPVGCEALLRWQHPTRGRLSPDQFIDVAEDSGLIATIGDWVLGTAMREAAGWNGRPGRALYVAVNVSARQFRTPGFTDSVRRHLSATGLCPDKLTIEITESLLLRDDNDVWTELQKLRRLGVRVAIDDFGTGYSALSYLRDVPLDTIKLDRSFIKSMTGSRQQRHLVAGIVGLAEVLGLDVIAEGIETQQERDVAANIGCAYGQGFLYSRPLPPDALRDWLGHQNAKPSARIDSAAN